MYIHIEVCVYNNTLKAEAEVYSAINPKPRLLTFLDFFTLRYFLLETLSLMKGGRERRYSFIYLIPVKALYGCIQGQNAARGDHA